MESDVRRYLRHVIKNLAGSKVNEINAIETSTRQLRINTVIRLQIGLAGNLYWSTSQLRRILPLFSNAILNMETSESTTTLPSTTNEDLTPLEQDVLDEYERLAENMKKVIYLIPLLSAHA